MKDNTELQSSNTEDLSDEGTLHLRVLPFHLASLGRPSLLNRRVGAGEILLTILTDLLRNAGVVGAGVRMIVTSSFGDAHLPQLLGSETESDELHGEGEEEGSQTDAECIRIFSPGIRDASSLTDDARQLVGAGFEEMDEACGWKRRSAEASDSFISSLTCGEDNS